MQCILIRNYRDYLSYVIVYAASEHCIAHRLNYVLSFQISLCIGISSHFIRLITKAWNANNMLKMLSSF